MSNHFHQKIKRHSAQRVSKVSPSLELGNSNCTNNGSSCIGQSKSIVVEFKQIHNSETYHKQQMSVASIVTNATIKAAKSKKNVISWLKSNKEDSKATQLTNLNQKMGQQQIDEDQQNRPNQLIVPNQNSAQQIINQKQDTGQESFPAAPKQNECKQRQKQSLILKKEVLKNSNNQKPPLSEFDSEQEKQFIKSLNRTKKDNLYRQSNTKPPLKQWNQEQKYLQYIHSSLGNPNEPTTDHLSKNSPKGNSISTLNINSLRVSSQLKESIGINIKSLSIAQVAILIERQKVLRRQKITTQNLQLNLPTKEGKQGKQGKQGKSGKQSNRSNNRINNNSQLLPKKQIINSQCQLINSLWSRNKTNHLVQSSRAQTIDYNHRSISEEPMSLLSGRDIDSIKQEYNKDKANIPPSYLNTLVQPDLGHLKAVRIRRSLDQHRNTTLGIKQPKSKVKQQQNDNRLIESPNQQFNDDNISHSIKTSQQSSKKQYIFSKPKLSNSKSNLKRKALQSSILSQSCPKQSNQVDAHIDLRIGRQVDDNNRKGRHGKKQKGSIKQKNLVNGSYASGQSSRYNESNHQLKSSRLPPLQSLLKSQETQSSENDDDKQSSPLFLLPQTLPWVKKSPRKELGWQMGRQKRFTNSQDNGTSSKTHRNRSNQDQNSPSNHLQFAILPQISSSPRGYLQEGDQEIVLDGSSRALARSPRCKLSSYFRSQSPQRPALDANGLGPGEYKVRQGAVRIRLGERSTASLLLRELQKLKYYLPSFSCHTQIHIFQLNSIFLVIFFSITYFLYRSTNNQQNVYKCIQVVVLEGQTENWGQINCEESFFMIIGFVQSQL